MIKQLPKQVSDKLTSSSVEGIAATMNLENYAALVRGKWKLIRGTDANNHFMTVLVGPYEISPDMTGYQILVLAGFQPVDAMQALGLDHKRLRTLQKNHRARLANAKANPRRGNTNSLDDL